MLNITGLDGPHISRSSKMAETKYIVLKGRKYVGRHKIYKEGEEFDGSELFGNADNIQMALKGGGPNDAKPRIKIVPKVENSTKKKDRNKEREIKADKNKDKDK